MDTLSFQVAALAQATCQLSALVLRCLCAKLRLLLCRLACLMGESCHDGCWHALVAGPCSTLMLMALGPVVQGVCGQLQPEGAIQEHGRSPASVIDQQSRGGHLGTGLTRGPAAVQTELWDGEISEYNLKMVSRGASSTSTPGKPCMLTLRSICRRS